jgi:hypothetical protein
VKHSLSTRLQGSLKQPEVEPEPKVEPDFSITDVSVGLQGGGTFTPTPFPPNATPAQEVAIWLYDIERREELGLL